MKHNTSNSFIKFECTEAGLGLNVTMARDCGADLPTFRCLKPEDFSIEISFYVQNWINLYELKHFVLKKVNFMERSSNTQLQSYTAILNPVDITHRWCKLNFVRPC